MAMLNESGVWSLKSDVLIVVGCRVWLLNRFSNGNISQK